MIFPDFNTFQTLGKQGNFIPVYQEWVADLDTPVSAWYKVCAGQPYSFLLESVEGGETLGRYSFLGCDPMWVLEANGATTTQTFRDGTANAIEGNPFEILQDCLAPIKPVRLSQLPPGIGGLFGFWGYELINWIEPTVTTYPRGDNDLPDGLWMQVDNLLIFDQVKRKVWAIAYADLRDPDVDLKAAYEGACDRASNLITKLRLPLAEKDTLLQWTSPEACTAPSLEYTSNRTPEEFCACVEKAKEHIRAGDIFQVVASQRLQASYSGDPFDLYRSLRLVNPSPYMSYFNFNGWQLIGSSPEVMVKATLKAEQTEPDSTDKANPDKANTDKAPTPSTMEATLRPIAGTRPRGKTPAEDAQYAADLLADPKEVAEHVMLVDLGRNDLGRVCTSGTVVVDELMVIENYSHVMHIVSNVVGDLAPDKTAWDLLTASFPAGTVSGAPKIRAMQIINDLEPDRRGPYSGVYGYYDFEGQLNSAITIRTMVVQSAEDGSQTISVQAGAGFVADSVPESEYQETLNKAKGMLEAVRCLKG
ncbi:MAG: anthranilate synthase component I family protein [Cyanobacteria bacterium P01_F01_bin.53]